MHPTIYHRHTNKIYLAGAFYACPCCGRNYDSATHRRTRGHLRCRMDAGPRLWIYQCHQCNADQRHYTLTDWQQRLTLQEDQRAQRVAELITRLRGSVRVEQLLL